MANERILFMKKREIPVMNVGISLIILIFMNICLAAFAVLSLENAVSDYSLSKKTATHTTQYYEAVNKVQEQLAKKNQELREKAEAEKKAESKTTEAKSSQKKAESKTTEIKSIQKKAESKTTEIKSIQKKAEAETAETKSTEKKIKAETVKNMQSRKDIKKVAKSQIKLIESVSKSQQLVVTLQLDETGGYPQYYIQKWKLCSSDDWQADDSLDVYQSGE